MRGRKSGSSLLVALIALLFSGLAPAAPVGAARPTGSGTLEICKDAKNGMAGRPFQFSIDGAAPLTVLGGACSGPVVMEAGVHKVVEAPTAGLQVATIAANHKVSVDLGSGTVVVKVRAGSTPAAATRVTYTNRKVPAVGLKICKATPDATLQGDSFLFTQNGGAASSVMAGTPAAPNCGPVTKHALGAVVHVAELQVMGTIVSSITVSDNRGSNLDTAARSVTATIGAGITVVTYTNIANGGPQFGYVDVCDASAENVTGTFDFVITGPGFITNRTVAVGQCSGPVQVPAGNITVTEAARLHYSVTAIAVAPLGRQVSVNLANRTATVVVPHLSNPIHTTVTFTNAAGAAG
jgi:hypothetical protein